MFAPINSIYLSEAFQLLMLETNLALLMSSVYNQYYCLPLAFLFQYINSHVLSLYILLFPKCAVLFHLFLTILTITGT